MNGKLSAGNALFPTLGDEIHHVEEKEGFVRCTTVGDLRVPIPPPVGPKICEQLEGLIKHLSERAAQASVRFF